jgi:transcriptional regulator with XRE-family HTH domain
MNPFLEQIGLGLKTERKSRRLNQTDAAAKAGLSRREVGEIEKGTFRGSVLKVQAYAMSLGFSITLEMRRRPTLEELPGIFDED